MLTIWIRFDEKTGVIEYEADPRRAERFVKQLGWGNAKRCKTPNEKKKAD